MLLAAKQVLFTAVEAVEFIATIAMSILLLVSPTGVDIDMYCVSLLIFIRGCYDVGARNGGL